jgi:transposase
MGLDTKDKLCYYIYMSKRGFAIHVATTTRKVKGKTYQTFLLRHNYREGGKVKHETVGNISHLPPHIIELIRRSLRGETMSPPDKLFEIKRSLPHGHVAAVLGTMRRTGFEEMLASRPSEERTLVTAMIVERIIDPESKLATARRFARETAASSLGEQLGIEDANEDDLYSAMDWLYEHKSGIETKLARKHLEDGALVLYDGSSSHYTGSSCPMAKFGKNAGKTGFPQINYGLICNKDGCPVGVEVVDGNIGDAKALSGQLDKLRNRFKLKHIIIVGDRGSITDARINEEIKPTQGVDWITALRAPAIRELATQGLIQPSLFDEQDMAEIKSPDFPGERLIVCRNPFLAEERTRKREELLKATEKDLEKVAAATRRARKRLKGKAEIGVAVGKVINHYRMAKHFKLTIGEDSFSYQRKEEEIAAEAALDGIYIIRTSIDKSVLGSEDVVGRYKDLALVERAFRCLKTVDLHVRPIYHWRKERVVAHIFLCMLAYYIEWHMRQALAPLLFDDEDKEYAQTLRTSVVAPAVRSPMAKEKDNSRRTPQGYPVHSFHTLLQDLATIAKNRVNTCGQGKADFFMLTKPTPLQKRVFELLKIPLSL